MTGNHQPRFGVGAVIATTVFALVSVPAAVGAPAHPHHPSPGAAGIGDRLYPTLGNGGYDAKHYDLRLRYATSAPMQGIDGTVTMVARSTQALSRFDLDFAGASVGSVQVNGHSASFRRTGEELVITPAHPIRRRQWFVVQVRHFTAKPTKPNGDDFATTAFFYTRDGSATAGQPNQSHYVFPSNDHPRDKASFSFRFDVPTGETAIANGLLTSKRRYGSRTIWRYVQRQPMATELTQLAVGRYTVIRRGSVGRIRVRDVVPTRLVADYRNTLSVERQHLRWMQHRVGAYPFDSYGTIVVYAPLGFALETQTLSLFDTTWFTSYPRGVWDPVMLHELAHQWFGDSVAPWSWSDVWLNEGHASWYELTYADQKGYLQDDAGDPDLETLMRDVYAAGDRLRADFGPVGRPLDSTSVWDVFNPNVYYGGALVLFALRQQVGDAAFQRIERAWVHRYAGRSASTVDFIRLASQVSGQQLHRFLTRWVYGTTTPPMPGHPDWTVDPVTPGSLAALSHATQSLGPSTMGLRPFRLR